MGVNRFTGSITLNNRRTSWFTQRAIVGIDYTREDARAIERFAPPQLAPLLSAAAAGGRIGQTLRHNTIITRGLQRHGEGRPRLAISSTSVGGQFYNTELNPSFLGGSGFPAPGVETVSVRATTGRGVAEPDDQHDDRRVRPAAVRVARPLLLTAACASTTTARSAKTSSG